MRLHHVAYVTPSVEEKMVQLTEVLGCRPAEPIVADEVQGVRIQFMEMSDGSLLELLEPHRDKSSVKRHLLRDGGFTTLASKWTIWIKLWVGCRRPATQLWSANQRPRQQSTTVG
jgi:hypothetical protein